MAPADVALIKKQITDTYVSLAAFYAEAVTEAKDAKYKGFKQPCEVETVDRAFDDAFSGRRSLPELYWKVLEELLGITRDSLPSRTAAAAQVPTADSDALALLGAAQEKPASDSGSVITPTTPPPHEPVGDAPASAIKQQPVIARDGIPRPGLPAAQTATHNLPVPPSRFSDDKISVEGARAPRKSLAVLPFMNMSEDKANEFLGDGIAEDLIIALSRVKGLRVPARTSSFAFKGKSEDIRRIGQLLNVETVLEGSVRKSGNKLRITAQLVEVREGCHLWSERYDREMKDVFDIQDDITRAIVGELQVQLSGGSETQFVWRQTASTAAYELYVRGRVYWNWRGVDLKKALHYFELALLEDPDYALAWSGMADAYVLQGFYDFLPCREALAKARAAAQKAVALDEHSAEAHSALGVVLLFHDWDSTRAKAELERAVQLNPGYSLARGWYSLCLAGEGRDEEALEQARLGVQGDPLSCFANAHLGWMHIILRRFDEAFLPLRRSLELHPNSAVARWLLGQACWFTGERETALAELQRAVDLSGRNPMKLSSLGWALALSGQTTRAREIQRELAERTTPAPARPLFLAVLHAAFGEQDLAFAALERALAERELWLPLPCAMAGLSLLASDPRWPGFVGRVEAARRASCST